MAKHVTKKQVTAAIKKLETHFGVPAGTFTAYEPGFHSSGWTVVAEENVPDQWTYAAWPLFVDTPVFAEPVNHWCLGLYPHS